MMAVILTASTTASMTRPYPIVALDHLVKEDQL